MSIVNGRYLLVLLIIFVSACESRLDSEQAVPVAKFSQTVTEAVQDLSGRLGISADEIEGVTEKAVTWRDGSLGCPKEDMMYTQALVEGTLIVLRVDGRDYQYHSGKGLRPFYCEHPREPAAKPSLD